MNPRYRGLGRMPQRHEVIVISAHGPVIEHGIPGLRLLPACMIDITFAKQTDVIASAKRRAGTLQHDDMHFVDLVGPLHGAANLARCIKRNRIEPFGSIEGDTRDARIAFILIERQGGKWRRDVYRPAWGSAPSSFFINFSVEAACRANRQAWKSIRNQGREYSTLKLVGFLCQIYPGVTIRWSTTKSIQNAGNCPHRTSQPAPVPTGHRPGQPFCVSDLATFRDKKLRAHRRIEFDNASSFVGDVIAAETANQMQ